MEKSSTNKQTPSESIHVRFTKENAAALTGKLKSKMKTETRSLSNCVEVILLEYFKLNKQSRQ